MCDVCDYIRSEIEAARPLKDADRRNLMSRIGDYIEETGEDTEHFQEVIDEVLDTTLTKRDKELEAIYQTKLKGENQ